MVEGWIGPEIGALFISGFIPVNDATEHLRGQFAGSFLSSPTVSERIGLRPSVRRHKSSKSAGPARGSLDSVNHVFVDDGEDGGDAAEIRGAEPGSDETSPPDRPKGTTTLKMNQ